MNSKVQRLVEQARKLANDALDEAVAAHEARIPGAETVKASVIASNAQTAALLALVELLDGRLLQSQRG